MGVLRIVTFLFLVSCVWSSYGLCGTKPAEVPKAKTIAELAARYDSSSCEECHEEKYEQWSNSLHAVSILGTPRTAPTILTSIDMGLKLFPYSGVKTDDDVEVRHLMMCAKCHLPQLDEATDDVAREIVKTVRDWLSACQKSVEDEDYEDIADELEEKIASLNIGCLVCHNKKAIVHKWKDGYPQPDTIYAFQEGEHDHPDFTAMGKAPALNESIFCGQCHGEGPNFELDEPSQCATLYGSYLFAYIPEGGHDTCQECHMAKSGLGHDMQAYRDEDMIKMAFDIEVEAMSHFWRKDSVEGVIPLGVINVEIYNKSGHAIPDG
ncbi:MAG: cytochrome C [Deltaproteobacteria bacterium]|nr:cytochrome C [Deltaproteobacteria bacterium]